MTFIHALTGVVFCHILIKARLQEAGVPFSKTHDLIAILELSLPIEPLWESFRTVPKTLNRYAVDFRYPGESATKYEAKEAVNIMRNLRKAIKKSLEPFK